MNVYYISFVVSGYYPEIVRHCQSFIRHKSTLVSPSVLKQNSIPYDKVQICFLLFFRSTPKSRLNNIYMALKCPSVRTSVCPQKVFPIPMKFGM